MPVAWDEFEAVGTPETAKVNWDDYEPVETPSKGLGASLPIGSLLLQGIQSVRGESDWKDKYPKVHAWREGLEQTVADNLDSLAEPKNLALMGVGGGLARLGKWAATGVAATFSYLMAKNLPDTYKELHSELAKPEGERDEKKVSSLITQGAIDLGGAGLGAAGAGAAALSRRPILQIERPQRLLNRGPIITPPPEAPVVPPEPVLPVEQPTTKGEPSASEISPTTEVHGDVQPLVQPPEPLPAEESRPGVQPQAEEGIQEGQAGDPLLLTPKPGELEWMGRPISLWKQLADPKRIKLLAEESRRQLSKSLGMEYDPAKPGYTAIANRLQQRITEVEEGAKAKVESPEPPIEPVSEATTEPPVNEAKIAELKRELAKQQKALDKNINKMGTMVPPPIVAEITRKIATRMSKIQDQIDALEKPPTPSPATPAEVPAEPPAAKPAEGAKEPEGWRKMPSVTPGGKSYFMSIKDPAGQGYYAAVWDRVDKRWKATDPQHATLGPMLYDSVENAKKRVEKEIRDRAETTKPTAPPAAAAKVEQEVGKVGKSEGTKKATAIKKLLVSELDSAIKEAPNSADVERKTATNKKGKVYETQPDKRTKITIDIPGDGVFTVWNTKENLTEIRDRAKAIKTTPQKGFKESKPGAGIPPEVFVESSEPTHMVWKGTKEEPVSWKGKRVELDTPNAAGLKTWLTSDGKTYEVVEESTGRRIGPGEETASLAMKKAAEKLDEYAKTKPIPEVIKENIAAGNRAKPPEPLKPEPPTPSPVGGELPPGLGGASYGIPAGDPDAQIVDVLKNMGASKPKTPLKQRFQIVEKVAEALSRGKGLWESALNKARVGALLTRDFLIGRAEPDTLDRISLKADSMRQRGTANARGVRQAAITKFKSEADREAMNNWLQAQMFDNPDAVLDTWATAAKAKADQTKGFIEKQRFLKIARRYEKAKNLSPDQKTAARQTNLYYESKGPQLVADGVLRNLMEDYLGPHMVDPASVNPSVNKLYSDFVTGRLSTNFKYAMRRVFETEFDLEMAGYKTVTKDIFAKLANYIESSEHVKANRWFVKQVKDGETASGEPWVDFRVTRKIVGEDPGAVLIKPNKPPKNPGEYVHIDHPAFRGWRWIAKDEAGRDVFVESDAWAHKDIAQRIKNQFQRSALYNIPGAQTLTSVQQELKGSKFSGTLFHPAQLAIHQAFHLDNPFNFERIDPNSPRAQRAMDSGVKIYEKEGLENFTQGIASSRWIQKIPLYGKLARASTELTFEHFFPSAKVSLFEKIAEHNKQRYAADPEGFRGYFTKALRQVPGIGKLLRPVMDDAAIDRLSAVQTNFAFGGHQWRAMGMSPEFVHMLHLAFRAPDFLASRLGFIARAGTKLGAEERMALAIGTATLWTLSRALNLALSGDAHMDDPFAVYVGKRRYTVRSVMGDAVNLVMEPTRYWRHRLSPSISSALELFTGVDAFNHPRTKAQQIGDIAKEALPIPLTPRSDIKWNEALIEGLGLHVSRTSDRAAIKKLGKDWSKKNDPNYREGFPYPESMYIPIRQALDDNKLDDARKEAVKLIKKEPTPERQMQRFKLILREFNPTSEQGIKPLATRSRANEAAFIKSLDAEGKTKYRQALKEEMTDYQRLKQAILAKPQNN